MVFFVLEIQKWTDGTWHSITYQYDNQMEAESKYHAILAYAATAKIPRNGASIIEGSGRTLFSYVYQHGEYEGYIPPEE